MKKKIIALVATMLVSIMSTCVVLAETQTQSVTNNGKKVVCTLACDFSLGGNDKALAMTSWEGKSGYSVKTELYYCKNIFSEYVLLDDASSSSSARVAGSKEGVWKFKSKHFIVNNGTLSNVSVCDLTDW